MSNRTVHVSADVTALSDAIADRFVTAVADAIKTRGVAHVSLTGGSMGTNFLEALGRLGVDSLDWGQVHLWWGDERFLPYGDADRNDAQADKALLSRLPLAAENVHRVAERTGDGEVSELERAAMLYASELRDFASDGEDCVCFDVMMLGMGPDTHVASIFPGSDQTSITDALTVAVDDSPKPPPQRVSLTFPALNNARALWLMVAGEDKADGVAAAYSAHDKTAHPASGVHGLDETLWLLDEAAASKLPEDACS